MVSRRAHVQNHMILDTLDSWHSWRSQIMVFIFYLRILYCWLDFIFFISIVMLFGAQVWTSITLLRKRIKSNQTKISIPWAKYKNHDLGPPGVSRIQGVQNHMILDMGSPGNNCLYTILKDFYIFILYIYIYIYFYYFCILYLICFIHLHGKV